MMSSQTSDRHGIRSDSVRAERRFGRAGAIAAALAIAASLSTGCAARSDLMMRTTESPSALRPEPGKALVVFLRPNALGYAIEAVVYDGSEFVGVVSHGTAVPWQAEPGQHRFMVVSEAADFCDADLLAGSTYFVEVVPRMGAWRARFSLNPLPAHAFGPRIGEWLTQAKVDRPNADAKLWAAKNQASVMKRKAKYEGVWLGKSQRPQLYPDDGVPIGAPAN